MPRVEVASGPYGNADTIFSHHPALREMSRTSRATSTRSWSWLNTISHIELGIARHAYHVEPEPQVDSLLAFDGNVMDGAVRQPDGFDPVAQGPGSDDDTCPPHRGQSACPVTVPHRRPVRTRDTGVETDTVIDPAAIGADRIGEQARIVVGMVVAERVLRVAVQVLPVDEGNGALDVGLGGHGDKK